MKLKILFLFSCLICCLTAEKAKADFGCIVPEYWDEGRWVYPGETCADNGYKVNGRLDGHEVCIDYNCAIPESSDTPYCEACKDGYYPYDRLWCMNCPDHGNCDGYSVTCEGGYTLKDVSYGLVCEKTTCYDENCESCSSDYCNICKIGYYLDYTGHRCYECPDNATCDGYTATCHPGYHPVYGYHDILEACEIDCPDNCQSCSSGGYCTQCKSGNYLSGGKCYTCPDNAVCSTTGSWSCISGYNKVGNACVPQNVISCPARMTLSSSGNCCVNK